MRTPRSVTRTTTETWQESFSLGTGLLFYSILAFITPALYIAGVFLFLIGIYFLYMGGRMQGRTSLFDHWVALKAIQAIMLIGVGLILLNFYSATFYTLSFLLIVIGAFLFLSLKVGFHTKK